MRTILLLALTTTGTCCSISKAGVRVKGSFPSGHEDVRENKSDALTKQKVESRIVVSLSQQNFASIDEILAEKLKLPKQEAKRISRRLAEIATKSRSSNPNLGRPIFKNSTRWKIGLNLSQNDIDVTENNAMEIFEDSENSDRTKRQVLKDKHYPVAVWQDGVFYTFNTSDPIVQELFLAGAKIWSDATCVDFVEDKYAQDKVVVVEEDESSSNIGKRGGEQILAFSKDSMTEWSAVHEIGHVLGLFHTMARYDRDNFIRVETNNIDPIYIHEFVKASEDVVDMYGLTYDYGSVMHYGELSGTINYQPTMVALDPYHQKTMGSQVISFSDIFMINEHYGCNSICNKSTSAKCVNEGYPHPRNCSTCICPGGYGGTLCDRRPLGCGEDLVATSKKQTAIRTIGFGTDFRDQFLYCNYMITAPEGKKVEVDLCSISDGYDRSGCSDGGVEIKAQEDQKLTGYRFCSVRGSEGPIVSSSNRLPIILFNRLGSMQAMFTYRYIE